MLEEGDMLNAEPPNPVKIPVALVHIPKHVKYLLEGDVSSLGSLLVAGFLHVGNRRDEQPLAAHGWRRKHVHEPVRVRVEELAIR